MIRLSQLLGQPTISLADAEHTGKVTGVELVGSTGQRSAHGPAGWSTRHPPSAASRATPSPTMGSPVARRPARADSPIGRRILDEDGDELGQLADLDLDADGIGCRSSSSTTDAHSPDTPPAGRRLVRRHRGRPAGHHGNGQHDRQSCRRFCRRAPPPPPGTTPA